MLGTIEGIFKTMEYTIVKNKIIELKMFEIIIMTNIR